MSKTGQETKLYLVRHGETVWNVEDKMQGVKDSPLTEKGLEHARMFGQALKKLSMTVDKIYTSDLGRAFDTAALIGEALNLEIHKDERLRERNMGIFEGHSWDSARELFPEEFAKTVSNDNDYRIPGGGTKGEYMAQVSSFLDYVSKEHEGQKILAVTHRGFVNFALRIVLHIPFDEKFGVIVNNTALTGFVLRKGKWLLEKFGDI
ncbi:MAG: histidine phosphatase family protein [Spirochaetes bacterium]|nr:histidine phosphatase family protein [Spirochaetota bacterium]